MDAISTLKKSQRFDNETNQVQNVGGAKWTQSQLNQKYLIEMDKLEYKMNEI